MCFEILFKIYFFWSQFPSKSPVWLVQSGLSKKSKLMESNMESTANHWKPLKINEKWNPLEITGNRQKMETTGNHWKPTKNRDHWKPPETTGNL